jgi:hypothetical protein
MKGKYVDIQIRLACLTGGKKRSRKMALPIRLKP